MNTSSPTHMPKKIRSMSPDVTVLVGKGDKKQEFQCYRVALSLASPVFDAMLSADMAENNNSRINLPEKDPDEWQIFYGIVVRDNSVRINDDNATMLPKWFHEFQMNKYLDECDGVLTEKVDSLTKKDGSKYDDRYWKSVTDVDEKKTRFNSVIDLLEVSCIYDLKNTKNKAEQFIKYLMETTNVFKHTHNLFDLPAITSLVRAFLPLLEVSGENVNDERRQYASGGKSDTFYLALSDEFRRKLGKISLDAINDNDMLPLLVSYDIEQKYLIENSYLYA